MPFLADPFHRILEPVWRVVDMMLLQSLGAAKAPGGHVLGIWSDRQNLVVLDVDFKAA